MRPLSQLRGTMSPTPKADFCLLTEEPTLHQRTPTSTIEMLACRRGRWWMNRQTQPWVGPSFEAAAHHNYDIGLFGCHPGCGSLADTVSARGTAMFVVPLQQWPLGSYTGLLLAVQVSFVYRENTLFGSILLKIGGKCCYNMDILCWIFYCYLTM